MSDITFKPGPLHGSPHKTMPGYVYVDLDTERDGENIGHLSGYVKPAVSALVLAAPDLLEALQAVFAIIDSKEIPGSPGSPLEKARAAIAAATGEA